MSTVYKDKIVIGRAERVVFPFLGNASLYARIDTGAKTSSIWATDIVETENGLKVRFADSSHRIHSHVRVFKRYDRVRIASSMGHTQVRFRIKMPVIIKNRKIMATFTLADRATQVYSVLIGRNVLLNKFVVDVSQGSPLKHKEIERSKELQSTIKKEVI